MTECIVDGETNLTISMKVLMAFAAGLITGISGSFLAYKRGFKEGKKAKYAFSRFRLLSAQSPRNRKGEESRKKGRRPLLIYLLIGALLILLFSVLTDHAPKRKATPRQVHSSSSRENETASVRASIEPSVIKKAPAVAKPTPRRSDLGHDLKEPSSEKASSYPYSLKLGAFRSREGAEKWISRYRDKGLSPYWVKVDLGKKGVWYRVYAEQFSERKQAEGFRRQHGLAESTVEKTQYAVLIGLYASLDELERKTLSLRNLGYCPYVRQGSHTKFRLFVGAFLTREGVERLYAELKSRDVQCQIALR